MAVTPDKAAVFVTGKTEDALSDTERASLTVLLDGANVAVTDYLSGGTAPDAVHEAAVLRLVYFDYWTRYARRPAGGEMLRESFRRDRPLDPLRASGAMAMLSPYKRRGIGTGAAS
ncbi:MAG: hypothetical protein OXG04_01840 [Acidobacteria bacterium]|nr:hypothetical protein [Acidobacteriota bacterium]